MAEYVPVWAEHCYDLPDSVSNEAATSQVTPRPELASFCAFPRGTPADCPKLGSFRIIQNHLGVAFVFISLYRSQGEFQKVIGNVFFCQTQIHTDK
jgi:hypothetical protein